MRKSLLTTLVATALIPLSLPAYSAITEGQVNGGNGVAIGTNSKTNGGGGVAIGWNAYTGEQAVMANNSVAVGSSAGAMAENAISVGFHSIAHAINSVAMGLKAEALGDSAVALGTKTKATATSSIALGDGSIADRVSGVKGLSFSTLSDTEASSATWKSSRGAVSVGAHIENEDGTSTIISRQITNVAAGSEDGDVVNVAQLKSLQQSSVFGTGASTEISPASEGVDAVMAQNATVLGNNGKVQANGAVAIGANSIAASRLDENGAAPTGYLMPSEATNTAVWQADVNHGVVSFGGSYTNEAGESVNFNRQITGVAAGSEDNDAVNVAQLEVVNEKADAANNTVQGLMTGETKVSTIQLTSNPDDASAPTIGLRYEAAQAAPVALADGDPVTPTTSQGRLVYNNLDAAGTVLGTETIATLSDGFKISGNTTASAGAAVDSVKVDLNQGISFLGDDYLQTTVTAGENGGATVTIAATQKLIDSLGLPGDQPVNPDPSNPGTGSGGSTGGNWTPTAAQQAALNGNFSNGITVAAAEGREAITIQQHNVNLGGNRIQNIGDGVAPTDAVNKRQLDNATRSLHNKINDVDKDLRAGIAMAMAVGNLPQAYMPGKSIVAMSAGTYHGQGGFALGLSHAMENRSWIFKGAASVDTRGNFGGTVSAGYQF